MPNIPVISVTDATQLLRRHLLAADTVTALVEDRIRSQHVVDPDAVLTYPLIITEMNTGVGGYQGGLHRLTVDLYTYSDESQSHAMTVYDALYLALQGERLFDASGVISAAGYAREVERPEYGYNNTTRSWWTRGTWILMLAG